ncbi:nitroreductase [Rhodopseudomonas palustris]|uniref:Nitroreductase n=1 Tax=Rhodopseudomonas palustris TaxID=1076 RepID=A0A323ULW5_RHOPL|nr:nitroreductase [Rhodopseudomonas palustris]PZA13379.1 nitroreductase [Rhodopseudomonas palustris]
MTDAAATVAPIDVLEQLMAARYSCRAFKADPVPREVIERILAAAQKTASWCNSQPWQVVITSGEATAKFREVIYPAAAGGAPMSGDFEFPREYRGVYLDRRRESGFQLYNAVGISRGDKAAAAQQALQNFNFFGAPHVAIITTDEALGVYGAVDCGGYVTSFLLAAQALGIATVPQAALAFHAGVVRKHFGLSDDRRVVCGISFGYADPEHKANSYRTNRAALGEVATFVE